MTAVSIKSWTDKVAVVTGAGSGIGQAVAVRLAHAGAAVAVSDVDEIAAERTATKCREHGVTARAYSLDVTDRDAIYWHADQVVQDFARVNFVINNAGVALKAPVRAMTDEQFRWVMDVNFWGVVHGSRAFLPHLIASGEGHLANVSSVFGLIGVPTQSAYNASKFAVRGFTEALRQEVLIDRLPVGVSCIHPGGVRTNIAKSAGGIAPSEREKTAKQFSRIARTSPDTAARTILRGVARGRARILIGGDAYVIDALPRLLGSAYQRVVSTLAKPIAR